MLERLVFDVTLIIKCVYKWRVGEDAHEAWNDEEEAYEVPWLSFAPSGPDLVTRNTYYRRCDSVSNLSREETQSCDMIVQANYILNVPR